MAEQGYRTVLLVAGSPHVSGWGAALQQRGCHVEVASSADEALRAVRGQKPAALLLSTDLPKSGAWTLCNVLKNDGELRALPLVLAGVRSTVAEQHARLRTRADRYVPVPAAPEVVADAVMEAMRTGALPLAARGRSVWSLSTAASVALMTSLLASVLRHVLVLHAPLDRASASVQALALGIASACYATLSRRQGRTVWWAAGTVLSLALLAAGIWRLLR